MIKPTIIEIIRIGIEVLTMTHMVCLATVITSPLLMITSLKNLLNARYPQTKSWGNLS
jgi:hypothetical protein